ncbi:MAG: hypothetical protein M2R45_02954 [Verrucomicrobia subdivision 3 bacterium]|nr:hypothetical protein [Limisphaerales bacterium]MCS1415326.1 hypothetical protein [Limisphaerales bacterium]
MRRILDRADTNQDDAIDKKEAEAIAQRFSGIPPGSRQKLWWSELVPNPAAVSVPTAENASNVRRPTRDLRHPVERFMSHLPRFDLPQWPGATSLDLSQSR